MVAKMTLPLSFYHNIYYHEKKLTAGVADLIEAANYLKSPDELTLSDKSERFVRLHALNKNTRRHTFHVCLQFPPEESLSNALLVLISAEYMQLIGFSEQPYLVYRHMDAGHPHVHLVSTTIRRDGSKIETYNLAKERSEPALRMLEEKYDLIRAKDRKKTIRSGAPEKLKYGKMETRGSISHAVEYIVSNYNYTSLVELNAIFSLYNLRADTGKPGGRISNNKGITYQMVDENGKGRGTRLKASALPFKPTFEALSGRFIENEQKRKNTLSELITRIDEVLQGNPTGWIRLAGNLHQDQIELLPLMNKNNVFYDLIFIDQHTKTAVLGSNLGDNYKLTTIFNMLGLNGRVMPVHPFIDPRLVSVDASRALNNLRQPETRHIPHTNDRSKKKHRTHKNY